MLDQLKERLEAQKQRQSNQVFVSTVPELREKYENKSVLAIIVDLNSTNFQFAKRQTKNGVTVQVFTITDNKGVEHIFNVSKSISESKEAGTLTVDDFLDCQGHVYSIPSRDEKGNIIDGTTQLSFNLGKPNTGAILDYEDQLQITNTEPAMAG